MLVCMSEQKLNFGKMQSKKISLEIQYYSVCTNATYTKYEPFFHIQYHIHLHWPEDHVYNIHNAYMITDR